MATTEVYCEICKGMVNRAGCASDRCPVNGNAKAVAETAKEAKKDKK